MKVFLLLCFIPSLLAAVILCPNSKVSCPEDKRCCEVDGKYSCCDLADEKVIPEGRMKVFPGLEIMKSSAFTNSTVASNGSLLRYGACDSSNCRGTCCPDDTCCLEIYASCCSDGSCCGFLQKCCDDGGCCSSMHTCCDDGCCPDLSTCCGDGCCEFGAVCCDSWCCAAGTRCGTGYQTCYSKGTTSYPEIVALLLLVASVFVSHRF